MSKLALNPARSGRLFAVTAAVSAALLLTGCAGGTTPTAEGTAAGEAGQAQQVTSGPVTVTDPWVKAIDIEGSDHPMTGAFGDITNDTDQEITIVSAKIHIAKSVELHETIVDADGSSMMQEIDGGFVIGAGETLTLKPGGDHIMLMGLQESVLPGDEIPVTLEFEGGETADFTFTAKEYTGGMETYAPDGSMGNDPHAGHGGDETDMGEHDGMNHDGMHHDETDGDQ